SQKQITVNNEIAYKIYETRYNPILEFIARDYQNKTVTELENIDEAANIEGIVPHLDFLMFLIKAPKTILNCQVNNPYITKAYVPNVYIPILTLQMNNPDLIYIVKNDYVHSLKCGTNATVEIDTPNLIYYEYIGGDVTIKSNMPKLATVVLRNTYVENLLFAPNLESLKIYNSYINYNALKINKVNNVYIENCTSDAIKLNKFTKATTIEIIGVLPNCTIDYANDVIQNIYFRDTQGVTEFKISSKSLKVFRHTGKPDHSRRANCKKVVLDCPNIEYVYLWEGSVEELYISNVEKLKLLELSVNNINVTKLTLIGKLKSLTYVSFFKNNLDRSSLEYIIDLLYDNIQHLSITKPKIWINGNPASLEVAGTRAGGTYIENG
ncbi:MAG: hypothetical protein ACK4MM_03650, partial [Fervidobacterium sp.]